MKRIESRDNKWIKRLNGLKIKKNRDKEGLFIAEGLRFIREIPKNWEVLAYAVSDAFAAENDLSLYEEKAEVLCLTDALFAAVCDTENPQGILAVCKKLDWDADAVLAKKTPFLLLAEELNDPGNLGTVIRTADACGADAVFLSKGSVDLYNPKVLRATMGSLFHVPVFQNIDLHALSEKMQAKQIYLPKGKTPFVLSQDDVCYYHSQDGDGIATKLVIDEEGKARGLSEDAAALCDAWVKIPMPGQAESLNASVAAGVLLYEVVRQRLPK